MPDYRDAELDELLGAFALDAVDDDEREQVARYLERNPIARAEVESFRETAAMLAFSGADAPQGLWTQISDSMESEPPRLRLPDTAENVVPLAGRSRRRSIGMRIAAVTAAAAAVLVALLGVQVAREGNRIDDLTRALERDTTSRGAEIARTDPRARTVTLQSSDGGKAVEVVLLPDGTGYVEAGSLAPLPEGRTYQLWALLGDAAKPTVISAGVLGPQPGTTAFRFPGPVVGFAVTDEADPGVVSSTQPAVVAGTF